MVIFGIEQTVLEKLISKFTSKILETIFRKKERKEWWNTVEILKNWDNLPEKEKEKFRDFIRGEVTNYVLSSGNRLIPEEVHKVALKEWKADQGPLRILRNYGVGGGLQ